MQNSTAVAKLNGHGIASQVIDALMADETFIPAMRDAIRGGLDAVGRMYDKESKSIVEWPDYKARLEAAKLAFAYGEGLPLQRIMQQTLVETRGDLHDALRESPQLLAAVEREVSKAKFRTRHVKQAQPVEIDAPHVGVSRNGDGKTDAGSSS